MTGPSLLPVSAGYDSQPHVLSNAGVECWAIVSHVLHLIMRHVAGVTFRVAALLTTSTLLIIGPRVRDEWTNETNTQSLQSNSLATAATDCGIYPR
jgi:hypothetical protein